MAIIVLSRVVQGMAAARMRGEPVTTAGVLRGIIAATVQIVINETVMVDAIQGDKASRART